MSEWVFVAGVAFVLLGVAAFVVWSEVVHWRHRRALAKATLEDLGPFVDRHTILLSDYEVANLRSVIEATDCCCKGWRPRNALYAIDNGVWLEELYLKLPIVEYKPHKTPDELAHAANDIAFEVLQESLGDLRDMLRAATLEPEEAKAQVVSKPGATIEVTQVPFPPAVKKAIAKNLRPVVEMEPCCECGENYPRSELLAGEVFCQECRKD